MRCSLLRPDPAQRVRLEEIRDNLEARIIEAKREGWLGEVEGLQVSYSGVKDKLAQIDTTFHRKAAATELGMPSFGAISGRAPTPNAMWGHTHQAHATSSARNPRVHEINDRLPCSAM